MPVAPPLHHLSEEDRHHPSFLTKADTCLRIRPLLLWKSIDPLITVVVTTLLAIRVAVAPLDIKAYSCNTLCLPKMIIEMDIPIIQIHTSTVVLGLALVQYHRPFNTVADLDLLCLASKATRHRSVNLLALRNLASSLLSVVPLTLIIVAILVIQTKSKDGTDAVLPLPTTVNGRETIGDPDMAVSTCSMAPPSHPSIHPPGLLADIALQNPHHEGFTRRGTGKANLRLVLLLSILLSAVRLLRPPNNRLCIMSSRG